MPVLEFVGLWQERLAAVQSVGCSWADSTISILFLSAGHASVGVCGTVAGETGCSTGCRLLMGRLNY
jgi:hypothetical protein